MTMNATKSELTETIASWREDAAQLDELGEEHAAAMLRTCAREIGQIIGGGVAEPTVARAD
jgi:hypothetical protein